MQHIELTAAALPPLLHLLSSPPRLLPRLGRLTASPAAASLVPARVRLVVKVRKGGADAGAGVES